MIRKYWKYLRFIAVPLLAALICILLYEVFDFLSMGVFADWLDRMFAYEESWVAEDGTIVIVHSFNWDSIKAYLLILVLVCILLGSWIFMLAADFRKRRIQRKTAHQISEYMHRFILQKDPLPLELPQEFAEVFAQISEVRYEMEHKTQMLREESQRKNDLITYLAHDLKTPLTSVMGYLTLLHDEPDLPDELRIRYTGIAVKKAGRLEELMAELFEITRFNLSQVELQKERINLSRMIEQICYEFHPLLHEKGLTFSLDIAPDVEILCDVDKIERVIDNLIRNAVSYSYPDSEICISMQNAGTDVQMVFQNHGRTIPPEQLNRVFEQFFRLDSSRSSTTGGGGLGLAIAKQLTEAHGGTIAAESVNELIRFTVTLPLNCQKIV